MTKSNDLQVAPPPPRSFECSDIDDLHEIISRQNAITSAKSPVDDQTADNSSDIEALEHFVASLAEGTLDFDLESAMSVFNELVDNESRGGGDEKDETSSSAAAQAVSAAAVGRF